MKKNNLLSNAEIKSEIENYKKSILANKRYSITFLVLTILFLLITSVSLILIFIFPDEEIPFEGLKEEKKIAWSFIVSTSVSFLVLLICMPLTAMWFYKTHERVQVHMPIILTGRTIDNCSIIVGIFNFITAILASMAPIFWGLINNVNQHERAWYADTKVIIYIMMCSLVFLFWSIIIPILQDKISKKDIEYFNRYTFFQYEKIPDYLEYLDDIFEKRAKQFNKELKKRKINKFKVNDIVNKPVSLDEQFSYNVRRIYKNHITKYGDEYQLIKYCLFIEIFSYIHKDEIAKNHLKKEIEHFLKVRNQENVKKFNKKLLDIK